MAVLTEPHTYVLDEIDDTVVIKDAVRETSNPYTIDSLFALRSGWPLPKPPPKPSSQRRVRFWAKDLAGNGLRMIEGTLDLRTLEAKTIGDGRIEYTVTGHMFPPIIQQLVPDEIAHDLLPNEPVDDALISSEIEMPEGFQPIGRIDPDALKIETKVDFDNWGGRTVKTREETTVEFSTLEFNPALMDRLFRR